MDHECPPPPSPPSVFSPTMSPQAMDLALKSFFGFSQLRPYQKDAIESIFLGRDCLVVMATGAGKSLCYQFPPIISKKMAIVVSPLLSLMQDQVMSLRHKGISADFLGCTQKNKSVTTNAENGLYDVLFLTPEKAMSLPDSFWNKVNTHGVCLFAVDEAHCISEWGPDFRQDYKTLHELRQKLPGVPFVALTATANDRVRQDIIHSLSLDAPFTSIGSFDRPNIYYSVTLMKGSCRIKTFLSLISNEVERRFIARESTIIYCLTISDTQDIYDGLRALGVSCGMYHGQMNRLNREKSHKDFVSNKFVVMIATFAFGMGIDKPDVRCVIHCCCPKSLESYYQESGRSGRDCLPSYCHLYYSNRDFTKGDFYTSDVKSDTQKEAILKSFFAAQKYCMIGSCRRRELLKYFGEDSPSNCGNCDNCTNTEAVQKDLFQESVLLLNSIKLCGGRFGLNMPISVLRSSKSKKITEKKFDELSVHGKGKSHSAQWWKWLASILISNGFIDDTHSGLYRTASLTEKGENLIAPRATSHRPLFFTLPREMVNEDPEAIQEEDCIEILDESTSQPQFNDNDEFQVYQTLIEVRLRLAGDCSIPPHAICGDELLRNIARFRPSDIGTLTLVDGVSQCFVETYGVIFLYHVRETCLEYNLSLDQFDFEMWDEDGEPSGTKQADGASTYEEVVNKVRIIVSSSSTGVNTEEIAESFPAASLELVLRAIEELDSSSEIFERSGHYFPL